MKLYLIKKKKGRTYTSEACAKAACGIDLEHDVSGRPVMLHRDGGVDQHISISDTKNWWGLLTADSLCGLDLEESSRTLNAITAKKLHPAEQQYLAGLEPSSSEWRGEFLNIWTRKESYMKFCGEGLRMGLSKFSVLDEDLNYAKVVQAKNHLPAFLTEIPAGRGLVAAVALETPEDLESVELCDYEGQTEKDVLDEAADLLAGRGYLSGDLQKRLRAKGYAAEESEAAVTRLQELGYVDDEAYARSFASDAARKGKGRLRIARELAQKGADAQTAKAALEAVAEDGDLPSERERAMEAAQRMLHGEEKPDEKMLARIGRRLSSLGYEPSVIWDVLGKLKS